MRIASVREVISVSLRRDEERSISDLTMWYVSKSLRRSRLADQRNQAILVLAEDVTLAFLGKGPCGDPCVSPDWQYRDLLHLMISDPVSIC